MYCFKERDVFSVQNRKDAVNFIGKHGYFTNTLNDDLSKWSYGELLNINLNDLCVFEKKDDRGPVYYTSYKFFIPEDKVIEKKKRLIAEGYALIKKTLSRL